MLYQFQSIKVGRKWKDLGKEATHEYFASLAGHLYGEENGLAHVFRYLLDYPVNAAILTDFPKTPAQLDQKRRALDPVPSFLFALCMEPGSFAGAKFGEPVRKCYLYEQYQIFVRTATYAKACLPIDVFLRDVVEKLPTTLMDESYVRLPLLEEARQAIDRALDHSIPWPVYAEESEAPAPVRKSPKAVDVPNWQALASTSEVDSDGDDDEFPF
jgi:hypothetical protein